MITIQLNGSTMEFEPDRCLKDVVLTLTTAPTGIAVAVNASVIPKSQWHKTTLSDGDNVEVLAAAPGG